MEWNCLCDMSIMFGIGAIVPDAGGTAEPATAEETEMLKIAVDKPTKLSSLAYQNTSAVAVSQTGTLAAFYPKPGIGAKFYRISTDAGDTWVEEIDFPPAYAGPKSVGLRDGGVLFMTGSSNPVKGGKPGELEASRIIFSDDFKTYELGTSAVSIPKCGLEHPVGGVLAGVRQGEDSPVGQRRLNGYHVREFGGR